MSAYCQACRHSENVASVTYERRNKKHHNVTFHAVFDCGATSLHVTSDRQWAEYEGDDA